MSFPLRIKKKFKKAVPLPAQFSLSISILFGVALLSSWLNPTTGFSAVALIMLIVMTLLAIVFDILPVLLAAVLSALTWNYFFIPPIYEFNFENKEDLILFGMYLSIAIVNAALSFQAKISNKKIREKEEKEKALVFYNTILNSLSHELRTPIASIIGSVDAIKEQNERLSAIQRNELLDVVSKAAVRLNQQVENLLGLSRLESGMVKLHLDWIDINELIHRVIQKRTEPRHTQTISFVPGENLPLFKLDTVLIEQVLLNLIQNAILYTPPDAQITISTKYVNENCQIVFMDNGPGFPPASIQSAFDKFYRIEQSNTGGTGLGLSIVKGFVEAHNGKVLLTNTPKGGACFIIDIPAETSFVQNLKYE